MNARTLLVLLGAITVSACARVGPVTSPTAAMEPVASRQLLVTTSQPAGASRTVLGDPSSFYLRRRGYGPTPGVDRTLDQIADDYGIRRVEGWFIASLGEYCEVFEIRPDQVLDDVIEQISRDPRVELVQAMQFFETEGIVYDDPYVSMQPALATLEIEAAHEVATGRGVTVAIVDSRIDRRHLELRGKVRSETNLVVATSYRGPEVHGTAVAGIIGSAANNGEGIVGVAPDSRIVALRACWTVDVTSGRAECSSFSLAQALESAMRLGADVINLSLAGPDDALLGELIDAALAEGIIVVAAAADAPRLDNSFPASHRGVIAAASADSPIGAGTANLLLAPGTEIMSTTLNNGYAFFTGNSMSAAYISGVSALVREHRPGIRPEELYRLLAATGHEHLVNACRAVTWTDGGQGCAGEEN